MFDRILILGNIGFIGSNLTNLFKLEGFKVKTLNREEFIDKEKLTNSIENSDVVINCIGSANVAFSYSDTEQDFESNVGSVRQVLEILRQRNLNYVRFINLSSAAVYGNPNKLPIKEIDQAQPISPYGFHKHMAELLLKEYSQCFGLKMLSLRIFSAYGNGQRKLLLWDLHQKILNSNGEITIFGTGNESRDFIHIEDIYQQLILAIDNSRFEGEAVNVANGKEVYIKEIVEIYKKHYPKSFTYQFNGENRPGDPLNWAADMSTMRNWGYENEIGVERGIKDYINWAVCL
jgi:UDP-glucose 4-epimerase